MSTGALGAGKGKKRETDRQRAGRVGGRQTVKPEAGCSIARGRRPVKSQLDGARRVPVQSRAVTVDRRPDAAPCVGKHLPQTKPANDDLQQPTSDRRDSHAGGLRAPGDRTSTGSEQRLAPCPVAHVKP